MLLSCPPPAGEEVLLIQEKLDGIKSRYAEISAGSSKALRTLEQALQLATRFASAHDDLNQWLDSVEAELNNAEADATPAYQERQKVGEVRLAAFCNGDAPFRGLFANTGQVHSFKLLFILHFPNLTHPLLSCLATLNFFIYFFFFFLLELRRPLQFPCNPMQSAVFLCLTMIILSSKTYCSQKGS